MTCPVEKRVCVCVCGCARLREGLAEAEGKSGVEEDVGGWVGVGKWAKAAGNPRKNECLSMHAWFLFWGEGGWREQQKSLLFVDKNHLNPFAHHLTSC